MAEGGEGEDEIQFLRTHKVISLEWSRNYPCRTAAYKANSVGVGEGKRREGMSEAPKHADGLNACRPGRAIWLAVIAIPVQSQRWIAPVHMVAAVHSCIFPTSCINLSRTKSRCVSQPVHSVDWQQAPEGRSVPPSDRFAVESLAQDQDEEDRADLTSKSEAGSRESGFDHHEKTEDVVDIDTWPVAPAVSGCPSTTIVGEDKRLLVAEESSLINNPGLAGVWDDEVVLQCVACIQKENRKFCLAAEGLGNRLCYLEPTSEAKYVPPDLCICTFVLEQSLSVRALQEMLAKSGQNNTRPGPM
ncbi:Ryanodine receptor 3, partial [Dissostichus eleginoides]